jgi:hypothetical protein
MESCLQQTSTGRKELAMTALRRRMSQLEIDEHYTDAHGYSISAGHGPPERETARLGHVECTSGELLGLAEWLDKREFFWILTPQIL